MQDDRLYGRDRSGAFARLVQGGAQRLAQSIDRGTIQPDQSKAVLELVMNQIVHGVSFW
ncbi:hypothetical protein D3C71_2237040 [compost metagenome]